ncbi:MAG: PQQ-dependent sugar dehydrogenase [Gammaproteobacteria bacterium]|nr:PQQ-dependent sugar dehydrogenase [Gammaproteobacteria bacterium]
MAKPKALISALLICLWFISSQSRGNNFQTELVTQLPGIPWAMAFIEQDKIIVTLRSGSVVLFDLQQKKFSKLQGLPDIAVNGQGGLLDVAVGPNYITEGWLYFTYVKTAATTLARAKIEGNRLTNWEDLLISDSTTDTNRHFGSRITFDDDGHVFFSIGDRGVRPNAQDLTNHAGSILRLTLEGDVPADNPFVGQPDRRDEIWSYGHRNPQGLQFDHHSKLLWSIEHGPRGGDEINLIKKGLNYGWPVVSHGKEYWGPISVGEGTSKPGMEPPLKVYIPSIAPGSLLLYSSDTLPGWRGNLFAGALKLQHLNRLRLSEDNEVITEQRLLEGLNERIRALAQSPEGWIYLSTDSGKIYRLRPK